jgi:adenosyl cobinamide kinase/adenosyl cobinamide phosphate guanylyltransferase
MSTRDKVETVKATAKAITQIQSDRIVTGDEVGKAIVSQVKQVHG